MGDTVSITFLFGDDIPLSVCYDIFEYCLALEREMDPKDSNERSGFYDYYGESTQGQSNIRLSVREIEDAIEVDDTSTIDFSYHDFSYLLYIDKSGSVNPLSLISLMVETVNFRSLWDDDSALQDIHNRDNLIELARHVYALMSPLHVQGYDEAIVENGPNRRIAPNTGMPLNYNREALEAGTVKGIFWYNIFRPKTVDTYGREALLSAPVWRATELDDGAIELITHSNPLDIRETYDRGDAVGAYLGL